MNEQQFLDLLESHLQKINPQELADIRRDFEEYFDNGRAEGKTTEDIIHSFGDMEELAEELLASYDEEDFKQSLAVVKNDSTVPYSNVKIDVDNVNISIVATDTNEAMIEIKDNDQLTKATMQIENDMLLVKATRKEKVRRFWFITIIGSVSTADVILYLPTKKYDQIMIDNHNGAIRIKDTFATQFNLKSDNGRVMTKSIQGEMLDVYTDNGRIVLENSIIENVKAGSSNGRIIAENCKGKTIQLESHNGRIELKDIEAKINARSRNGRIEAKINEVKNPLQLKTDNGRILLTTIGRLENVTIESKTDWGSVSIYNEQTSNYSHGTKENPIHLQTSNGKITVEELVAQ